MWYGSFFIDVDAIDIDDVPPVPDWVNEWMAGPLPFFQEYVWDCAMSVNLAEGLRCA